MSHVSGNSLFTRNVIRSLDLRQRNINGRLRLEVVGVVAKVIHDTDDVARFIEIVRSRLNAHLHAIPERIRPLPVPGGHRPIDDGHRNARRPRRAE